MRSCTGQGDFRFGLKQEFGLLGSQQTLKTATKNFLKEKKKKPIIKMKKVAKKARYGILLPKLFWLTVRKNCSSDKDKLLKFEAEGREFANILRSLEQFIQTVKGQNNFC